MQNKEGHPHPFFSLTGQAPAAGFELWSGLADTNNVFTKNFPV
jgi:hypothetical protein